MKISVIIPTFNRAELLARALISVQKQTLPADEIIVVDDGSDDNTRALIENKFPNVQYLYQSNKGVSAARNFGISQASGEWIAFLDSDDEWLPNKLARQRAELDANKNYKVCHTNEVWIRNGKFVNAMRKHEKSGGNIYQLCLPLCIISPSSIIIHRSVFNDVGIFDESLPACEDYDLWLRICAKYPVLFLKEKLITKYGGHDDQLSRRYWGMDRFRIYAMEKILKQDYLQPNDLEGTLYMIIKKIGIVLEGAKKNNNHELIKDYSLKKNFYVKHLERVTTDQRESLVS